MFDQSNKERIEKLSKLIQKIESNFPDSMKNRQNFAKDNNEFLKNCKVLQKNYEISGLIFSELCVLLEDLHLNPICFILEKLSKNHNQHLSLLLNSHLFVIEKMNRLSESMNFKISDEIIKVSEYERKPLNLIEKFSQIEEKRNSMHVEHERIEGQSMGFQLEESKKEPIYSENEQDLEEVNELLEEREMKLQQIEMLEARNESAFNKLMDVRKNLNKKQTLDEDFYHNDDSNSSFESQRKDHKENLMKIKAEERKNERLEYKNRKKNVFTEPDPEIFNIQQLEISLVQKDEEIARLVQITSKSEFSEHDKNVKLALFQKDYEVLRQEHDELRKKIVQLNFNEAKSNYDLNELKKNINELRNEVGKYEILLEAKEEEIFTLKNQDSLHMEVIQKEISTLKERIQENEEIFQAELQLKNEKIEQYLLEIEENAVKNLNLQLLIKENNEQLIAMQKTISNQLKETRDIQIATDPPPRMNSLDSYTQYTWPNDHKSIQVELDLEPKKDNNSDIYSMISNVLASTPNYKKETSLDIYNELESSVQSTPKYSKGSKLKELGNLVRPSQKESVPHLRNLRTNIFATKIMKTEENEQNVLNRANDRSIFDGEKDAIVSQVRLSSRNNRNNNDNNNNNSHMDSIRNYSNSSREEGYDLFTEEKLRKIYESFRKVKIKNMFKKDDKLNRIEGFEDFKGFFSVFLLVHKKCGRDCIHLKRFYEKIGFKEERRGSSRLEVKPKINVIKHLPKI